MIEYVSVSGKHTNDAELGRCNLLNESSMGRDMASLGVRVEVKRSEACNKC